MFPYTVLWSKLSYFYFIALSDLYINFQWCINFGNGPNGKNNFYILLKTDPVPVVRNWGLIFSWHGAVIPFQQSMTVLNLWKKNELFMWQPMLPYFIYVFIKFFFVEHNEKRGKYFIPVKTLLQHLKKLYLTVRWYNWGSS